jgi:hypothetical protein
MTKDEKRMLGVLKGVVRATRDYIATNPNGWRTATADELYQAVERYAVDVLYGGNEDSRLDADPGDDGGTGGFGP